MTLSVDLQPHDLAGENVGLLADVDTGGGIPVLIYVDVPDGATGDIDVTLAHKLRVLDVLVQKKVAAGGASDTIQLKNGSNAISDALDINVADNVMVRAATLDDAQADIASGGTLRVTRTKVSAADVACLVTILGVRVS